MEHLLMVMTAGRLLVVTPSDVVGGSNSRTQHLVRHLGAHFRETLVISRRLVAQRYDWSALVRMRTDVRQEGSIRWISYNPWGHIRDGLGLHLLGLPSPYAVPGWGARRVLRRLLSPLGGVLDVGLLPSLAVAYARRVGGPVDVFIGQGPWEVCLGLLLRSLGRARLVLYDDMDYQPGFMPVSGLRRRWLATLEHFAIRRADRIISVGHRLARLRLGQGARDVWVIPNGVDLDRFREAVDARRRAPGRRPTLIYAGYLGAWAGVDLVLEATAHAVRQIPNLRVILLGHGSPPEVAALRQTIQDRDLVGVVEFRGLVAYHALPAHLAEADIGVAMFRPLDLTRYAFPLKVVEYMAAGLPVLTTSNTEGADLVTRLSAGSAVPFDATAVAQAAIAMLADRPRYRELSANAQAGSQAYDWTDLMAKYHTLLRATVDGTGLPAPADSDGDAWRTDRRGESVALARWGRDG